MATDNPRIAAYVPKAIHDRIKQFKKDRELKSESQAITLALSEFFGVSQKVTHSSSSDLVERIEIIENRVAYIKGELLNELKSELLSAKSGGELYSESPNSETNSNWLNAVYNKPKSEPHRFYSESSSSSPQQAKDLGEAEDPDEELYDELYEPQSGPSSSSPWQSNDPGELEDPDDEPDEILTDFLQPEPAARRPVTPQHSEKGGEWLTTGEAYKKLVRQGFQKRPNTLRRWLKDAIAAKKLPPELERMGLEADFETRASANPKDNSVRWLRVKR